MSRVASVEPVSTTINSPARPRTESSHRGRWRSSFLTTMHMVSVSGTYRIPVPILQCSRADAENVNYVPQVSADQRQTAIAIVAPADRHLLNRVAQAAGQHQDLDIEHISID